MFPSMLRYMGFLDHSNLGSMDVDGAQTPGMLFSAFSGFHMVPFKNFKEPNSDCLRPTSDGLQPNSDGHQPASDGLQPNSDGLNPSSHGLHMVPLTSCCPGVLPMSFAGAIKVYLATSGPPCQMLSPCKQVRVMSICRSKTLGAKTLLGAKGIAPRTTRIKDSTKGPWPYY